MLVQKENSSDVASAIANLQDLYNNCFRKDVHVFHTGGIPRGLQDFVVKVQPLVHFHLLRPGLHWRPAPQGLKAAKPDPQASLRYGAARWHSLGVVDALADLGYEWVMRWDASSWLMSCVTSDPFLELESRGLSHGHRVGRTLPRESVRGLPYSLKELAARQGTALPPRLLARFGGKEPHADTWDRYVEDTSGSITRISFWKEPEVRSWLESVDAAGLAYHGPVQEAALLSLARARFAREDPLELRGWSFVRSGEVGVAPGALLPWPLRLLLPSDAEWRVSSNDLVQDPRYAAEVEWAWGTVLRPMIRRDYWVFRFLKYL